MMNLYKSHMRSKAEYCCVVWSPSQKKDIRRLERKQKWFTKKIGLKGKNYHQRLKCLNLYSMERREMYDNTWQQIEDPEKNLMGFEMNERARYRTIKDTRIKWNRKSKNSTLIFNSPARKIMRLFNAIPGEICDITGKKTEFFKRELDRWLSGVPPTLHSYVIFLSLTKITLL